MMVCLVAKGKQTSLLSLHFNCLLEETFMTPFENFPYSHAFQNGFYNGFSTIVSFQFPAIPYQSPQLVSHPSGPTQSTGWRVIIFYSQ